MQNTPKYSNNDNINRSIQGGQQKRSQSRLCNFLIKKDIFMKFDKTKAQQMNLRKTKTKSRNINGCKVTADFQYGSNSAKCANLSLF